MVKPDVKVELNGTVYRIRLTTGALIRIEDDLGIPITQMNQALSLKQSSIFIRHALRHDDGSRIDTQEWDDILEEISPAELFEAIGVAMTEFAASTKPEQGKETPTKN